MINPTNEFTLMITMFYSLESMELRSFINTIILAGMAEL